MILPVNSYTVSSLLASAFCLAVSAVSFAKGERSQAKIFFSFVSMSVGFWTLFPAATSLFTSPSVQTTLARIVYISACVTPTMFFLLVASLTGMEGRGFRRLRAAAIFLSVAFLVFIPTPWFIAGVQSNGSFRAVSPGLVYHLYIVFFCFFFSYSLYALFRNIGTTRGIKRNQLRYVFAAFFVGCLGGTIHFLAVYIHAEPFPHDIFIIAFVAILAYAIVRHRLMDVNLAARYALVQVGFGLLVGLPLTAFVLLVRDPVVTALVVIMLGIVGPHLFLRVREHLTDFVDKLPVFKGRYERFNSLQAHIQTIGLAESVSDWARTVVDVTATLFRPKHVFLLVRDESRKRYLIQTSRGLDAGYAAFTTLAMKGALANYLEKKQNVLISEMVLSLFQDEREREEVRKDLTFLQATLCAPIEIDEGLFAVLVLGEKEGGSVYNDVELTSLMALARGAEHALRVVLSGLAREQLTSVWAHDLVKPFTLKGSFQYLEELNKGSFGFLSPEGKRVLGLVLGDITFVRENLKRLLHPGQVERFNILPGSLTGVYSNMKEKYTIESLRRGIRWSVEMPPEGLRVFCDGPAIEHRVLANLVENAFRHTPKGGAVSLGYRVEDKCFIGHLQDSGVGINKENIPALFKARSQLKSEEGGLAGLGLFSAKSVVESHRGKIWVESDLGKGSTFFFTLPLAGIETV